MVPVTIAAVWFFILYRKSIFEKKQIENREALNKEEYKKQSQIISNLTKLYDETLEMDRQKTEFFSNITHELKTPLSVVLGSIQLVEKKYSSTFSSHPDLYKQFRIIRHNCYKMLRLTNNILEISRIEAGYSRLNLENCNIVYLIEEIVQSIIPYAEQKELSVEFDTEEEEIITAVDIDKIERIFLNLLSNAIKYTERGGKVRVYIAKKTNHFTVSVKDNGPGIPECMQEEVFKRFQQVTSHLTKTNEGSGIGLSLVKTFVELHNGRISLISKEGEGSEFIVEIPLRKYSSEKSGCHSLNTDQSRIIEAVNIEFSDIYEALSR